MARTQGGVAREQCVGLRQQGDSLRLIAEKLGLSFSAVRYHVRDIQVETSNLRGPHGRKPNVVRPPLVPSEDLAYLLGVFAGDGCLSRLPRTFKFSIACDNRYPDLIAKYAALLERLTGCPPIVQPRRESKATDVMLHGVDLPTLFGIPCGRKTESGFQSPAWVFEEPDYLKPFVRGLIETDGGIYKRHRADKGRTWECIFVAYNSQIMADFLQATSLVGYCFHQNGVRASLSNTKEVRRLVEELEITKCCDYTNTQSQ